MVNTYIVAETPQRYVGRCEPCDRPVAVRIDPKGSEKHFPHERMINCPDCGGVCQAELLFGVLSKMSCDARCMGAYGPSCECACGGQNHSGRWEEKIDNVPAHVIEKYREDRARRLEEAKQKYEAAVAEKQTGFAKWAALHAMEIAPIQEYDGDISFILDIKRQLDEFEVLSPRQIETANRIILERAQKDAAREAIQELYSHSTHQGAVGDKLTIQVEIDKIIALPDYYTYTPRGSEPPTKPMYIMRDEKGNVYVWKASSYQGEDKDITVTGENADGPWSYVSRQWQGWSEGDKITLKGTVKEHSEYNGTKQTMLTRCKKVS